MRKALIYVSIAIFLGVLGLSWLTHGTGVVGNDIARNIYIPKELTMPLQVKAAYNGRDMLFRYRWPARQPSIYHDMMKFDGGKWVRYGASTYYVPNVTLAVILVVAFILTGIGMLGRRRLAE
jgi:hypothetical protein